MNNKIIETSRLKLRTPNLDDVDLILDFIVRNKAHFENSEPIRESNYFKKAYQLDRIKKLQKSNVESIFYIFRKDNQEKIIGEIGISNIAKGVFQNCNIGYKLDQSEVGEGYMMESIKEITKFIFEDLELHRIEANIIPKNKKSIVLVERLGFRREGLSKKLLKIKGIWEDHFRYALIKEDLIPQIENPAANYG